MSPWFLNKLFLLHCIYVTIAWDDCSHGYIDNLYCLNGPQSFLQWLLYPITLDEFFNNYWDQKPLHISRKFNTDYYKTVYLDQVYTQLLAHIDIPSHNKFEEVRVIKYDKIKHIETDLDPFRLDQYQPFLKTLNGEQIHQILDYHKSLNYHLNEWDAAAFGYLLSQGYSLRFFETESFSNVTKHFVSYFENETGNKARSNLYYTPKHSKAFSIHHDVDDIFILQVNGQKHWTLYGHAHNYCTKVPALVNKSINLCESRVVSSFDNPDYRVNISKYITQLEANNDLMEWTIEKGDLLYLPRGQLHEANNEFDKGSVHISLGIYSELYVDFLYHFIVNVIQVTRIYTDIDLIKLTQFLRKKAFKSNGVLRKYMPYNFILNDKILVSDKTMKRFNKYLKLFLKTQNMNEDQVNNLMESINSVLESDNIKNRLKISLRQTYASDNYI
eukprot:347520_1